MGYFAGLDVSMEETHVCVLIRSGVVIYGQGWRLHRPVLRPHWLEFRPVDGFYSKRAGWRRCSITA